MIKFDIKESVSTCRIMNKKWDFMQILIHFDWILHTLSLYLVFDNGHLFSSYYSKFMIDSSYSRNWFPLYICTLNYTVVRAAKCVRIVTCYMKHGFISRLHVNWPWLKLIWKGQRNVLRVVNRRFSELMYYVLHASFTESVVLSLLNCDSSNNLYVIMLKCFFI
jgi:hypothetical protein